MSANLNPHALAVTGVRCVYEGRRQPQHALLDGAEHVRVGVRRLACRDRRARGRGFGGSQGSGLSVEVGSLVLPVPLAWAWGPLKDRQSPLQVGDQVVGVLQAD